MSLSSIANTLNADYHGPEVNISSISTDTRSLKPGDLFVALTGDNFDGHAFIDKAAQSGAAAAIVSREIQSELPAIQVDSTGKALMQLASSWRNKMQGPVVAITGSNGKTTVKEMVASILSRQGKVLATQGNFNNEIGLPLTLFRLADDDEFAVLELGANAMGEIGRLTQVARPDVAVLTNAGPAHLEGFGSLENVATAKGEIFSGLSDAGVAVINADDRFAAQWKGLIGSEQKISTFSMNASATVCLAGASPETTLTEHGFHTRFSVRVADEIHKVNLQLAGTHNVRNALAAIAATHALNIDIETIIAGLASLSPVAGRLSPVAGLQGARVINDSYNANPGSVSAALELLAECEGERWLVLGDMGELGDGSLELHEGLGLLAKEKGIEHVFTCGELSQSATKAFGSGGQHFDSQADMISDLRVRMNSDVIALVKGSRSQHMESVVTALTADAGLEGC